MKIPLYRFKEGMHNVNLSEVLRNNLDEVAYVGEKRSEDLLKYFCSDLVE